MLNWELFDENTIQVFQNGEYLGEVHRNNDGFTYFCHGFGVKLCEDLGREIGGIFGCSQVWLGPMHLISI